MRLQVLVAAIGAAAIILGGLGCDETIEKYNPSEPRFGARQYPTPRREPVPSLTRAAKVAVDLHVDEHFEPDDHIILVNRSDGAVYGIELIVNNDYHASVPLLEMGDTVRIPETWLKSRQGRPFPSERRVRIERVEVRHAGKLIRLFDVRGGAPPPR